MKRKIEPALIILPLILILSGCDSGDSPGQQMNKTIVCFGDSLTEGFGASNPGSIDKTKSYPAYLQGKVSQQVVNAGISGDTASDGLLRLEKDVLSKNPGIVIILFGANDFMHLRPADDTKSDLQEILARLKNKNCKIFLASFIGDADWETTVSSMIPALQSSAIKALLSDYKKMYDSLVSENRDITFIPNIWTGVWGINMSDPIHPNSRGYEIIANVIFNAISPYLQ